MRKLQLNPRDRLGLLLAALAVTVVLAWLSYMPAGPLKRYRESIQEVETLKSNLLVAQLARLDEQQRVEAQKWIKKGIEERGPAFKLMTFLDDVVREKELGGRAQLQNQSPPRGVENVELVNISMENVSLPELVDFLHSVYASGKLVVVYNLSFLGPGPENQGLECRVTFLTLKV